MACQTPYRGDTSQMLLYKIASCLAEGGGGGGAGVTSFNGRTGVVTLTSGDVTTALGFTPISQTDGDARYVLKAGDTMTGKLQFSGTTHVGLRLNNLTTAQRNAIAAPTAGDLIWNTTTTQVDRYDGATWGAAGTGLYVLKAGDTMTGALTIGNGVLVASAPALNLNQTWNNGAVTFNGLFANYTNTASASDSSLFNFQTDGIDRFRFNTVGQLFAARQDATDSGMSLFLRKRGNTGGATNAVAADSTVGTVQFSSWDGTAYANGSRISGLANQAWTNVAHGSRIDLYTTPDGSTTEQITLRLAATGQALFTNGTAALPALSFQSDLDTGIYRIGANSLGISAGGVLRLTVDGTSTTSAGTFLIPDGTAALPGLAFSADTDTGIYRIGANSFGSSAGGSVILATSTTGINLTTALAYQYNSVNVIRAQTALSNYFFGPSGNLTMTGTNNTTVAGGLGSNTTGSFNTSIGNGSLAGNTTGTSNCAFGVNALFSNTTGGNNVAMGVGALFANTTGGNNFALGTNSLTAVVSGSQNISVGTSSLAANLASDNIAIGTSALAVATTSSFNVAIGTTALRDLTTSTGENTVIGYNSGRGITTGVRNTIIGANVAGLAAALSSNIILADGSGAIKLQIDGSGNTTLAGTVATAAGTAALPAHTFSADLDTGIYRVGANHLGISANGAIVLGVGAAALGFFAAVAAAPVAQQVSGANLTNNVTAGGVNDTIADYADLVVYANDAAAIRADIYQLARKLAQVNNSLRAYGLLT